MNITQHHDYQGSLPLGLAHTFLLYASEQFLSTVGLIQVIC